MPFSQFDAMLGRVLLQHKVMERAPLEQLLVKHANTSAGLAPILIQAGVTTEAQLKPYLEMAGALLAQKNAQVPTPSKPQPVVDLPLPAAPPAPPAPFGRPLSSGGEGTSGTYAVRRVPPAAAAPAQQAITPVATPAAAPLPQPISAGGPLPAPISAGGPLQKPATFAPPPPPQALPATAKGGFTLFNSPPPPKPVEEPPVLELEIPELELEPVPPPSPFPTGDGDPRTDMELILRTAAGMDASDLHLHSGMPVMLRLNGVLAAQKIPPYSAKQVQRFIYTLLSPEQIKQVEQAGEMDFACTVPGAGRFRVNVYKHQRGMDATFRIIPETIPSLKDLGLPESIMALTKYHNGMLLFTGPAGCGKSSTMAAVLGAINAHHDGHILTIEDPIEYVHRGIKASVNQRQVGAHTGSFARALKGALREDPDIIAIGELRDLETISLAMSAAETGHLVLGTLHTANAIRTVNRIINAFPPRQQDQTRAMLSESLRGVVSQRLVRPLDGSRRIPALEVMVCNKAVGNLIRENKTLQIRSILQTSSAEGMYLLDNSLASLVTDKIISREEALQYAEEPKRFGG